MTEFLLAFMSFGFTEMLLVGVVALLVFGGQLPEVMRTVGQAYAKFRQGLHEIAKPVRDEIHNVTDISDVTSTSPRRPRIGSKPTASVEQTGTAQEVEPVQPAPSPRAAEPWGDEEPPPV